MRKTYLFKDDSSIWGNKKKVIISGDNELIIEDVVDHSVEKISFSKFIEISEDKYFVRFYKYFYVIVTFILSILAPLPRFWAILFCVGGGIAFQVLKDNRAYSLRFAFKGPEKTFELHSTDAEDGFLDQVELIQRQNPELYNFRLELDSIGLKYSRIFMIIPFIINLILCFVFEHYETIAIGNWY